MSDLENRLKSLINTIRVAVKPELAIPKDQEKFPINYRISRIKDLLGNVSTLQEELNISLKNITTNLEGLLEELNTEEEPKTVKTAQPAKKKETSQPASTKASTGADDKDKKPAKKATPAKKSSKSKDSKKNTASKSSKADKTDK